MFLNCGAESHDVLLLGGPQGQRDQRSGQETDVMVLLFAR